MKTLSIVSVLRTTLLTLALALTGCSADRASNGNELGSGVRLQNFDRKVRPQDDFYRYVNGAWLAATEIPADKSNYGLFAVLSDQAEKDLHAILEAAAARQDATGDLQKVG